MKKSISTILLVLVLSTGLYSKVEPVHTQTSADLQIALQKLNVLASVLYLAAHPDDENTGLLAYLSKDRKYRSAYLSLTRGDGGQNLIGPEKGSEIGLIRTHELLEARQIDGAEQYFTRAVDFGYSKTAEETFKFWGREKILADVVWVIRKFKPDVIITRFTPDGYSGHGHHTASALLAMDAFKAAGDASRFPEQLKYVDTWQPKRMFWNSWRPNQQQAQNLLGIDIGVFNPLLGKSYTEIAAESRSMHKSQGFGAAGRRGESFEYFDLLAGEPAATDIMENIDTSWDRIPGGKKIGAMLKEINAAFDPRQPDKSLPALINLYAEMNSLPQSDWTSLKIKELKSVIQGCAGLWMEAIAQDYDAAPGSPLSLQTTLVNRCDFPFTLENISIPAVSYKKPLFVALKNNHIESQTLSVQFPKDFPLSQPYWLREPAEFGSFVVTDQQEIGLAENPPALTVSVTLKANGQELVYSLPVLYRWTDRAIGELYRPLEIRPPVTVNFDTQVLMFSDGAKTIPVKLKSSADNQSGILRISGPENWKVTPAEVHFTLVNKHDEKTILFEITSPTDADEATLTAIAEIDGQNYSNSLVEISYPHIDELVLFPESTVKVVNLDIQKTGERIGYIMGSGDEIPEALTQLGYSIEVLSNGALENGSLAEYDAIITGVRAWNTEERLKYIQPKLMQYVQDGGTLVVQYNVNRGLQTEEIGPYPLTISRDRVSDETAAITLLDPNHPLLNNPNKITQKDFENWVQERGLYFCSEWDDRYQAVLSSHDPGEPERNGGLLYTRYGKGVFIYTGYSWFRQLPAGVPGAYRLFVNLLSAGASHEK